MGEGLENLTIEEIEEMIFDLNSQLDKQVQVTREKILQLTLMRDKKIAEIKTREFLASLTDDERASLK